MAKGNGTTIKSSANITRDNRRNIPVHVNLGGIKVQGLFSDTDNHRESFIDLEQGDVLRGEVGFLESLGKGDCWCFGEVDRIDTSISPGCGSYKHYSQPKKWEGYSHTTLARGLRPSSFAFSADMRINAEAPSLNGEELAAVMAPPALKADFKEGTFS
jgi:hypothetical protein